MGFDLTMLHKPKEIIEGYIPQSNDSPEYWRFVSSGMAYMVELMKQAEVLDFNIESKKFPKLGFILISKKRLDEIEDWIYGDESLDPKPTDKERKKLVPYKEKLFGWRTQKSSNTELVPYFKFVANDGFIVTPQECNTIYNKIISKLNNAGFDYSDEVVKITPIEELNDWLKNWAYYNKCASYNGGYLVG